MRKQQNVFSISEYIRNRRLALAGNDLATSDQRVINIDEKMGNDTFEHLIKEYEFAAGYIIVNTIRKICRGE